MSASRDPQPTNQERLRQEMRAREHVGAAGFAQMGTLERLIAASREQLNATEVLRQLVHQTLVEVRGLPLSDAAGRESRAAALADLLAQGQRHLEAAEALDAQLGLQLAEVAGLDLREVNVRALETIHNRVRGLIGVLGTIIEAARAQARGLEQVRALDALSAEHQARLSAIARAGADAELDALASVGSEAAARIAQVEDAASPRQVAALGEIGHAATEQLAQLDAPAAERAGALRDLADHASREAESVGGEPADGA